MVIPMDTRLLKMLVFLFEVEKIDDPPHHALYDSTVEEGPRSTEWFWEAGPAVISWDHGLDDTFWQRVPNSRRMLITITQ